MKAGQGTECELRGPSSSRGWTIKCREMAERKQRYGRREAMLVRVGAMVDLESISDPLIIMRLYGVVFTSLEYTFLITKKM